MVQSRRELLDQLVEQITRETAGAAGLGAEERVLARQQMEKAVQAAAEQAHRDVIALAYGDRQGAEPDRFADYLDTTYRSQRDLDLAQPDAEPSPARQLGAEIVASDDRLNHAMPDLQRRAGYYIAHQVTVAAERVVQKPRPPAAAAGAAAAAAVGAAAPVAPIAVVKAGVDAVKARATPGRGGQSIG